MNEREPVIVIIDNVHVPDPEVDDEKSVDPSLSLPLGDVKIPETEDDCEEFFDPPLSPPRRRKTTDKRVVIQSPDPPTSPPQRSSTRAERCSLRRRQEMRSLGYFTGAY